MKRRFLTAVLSAGLFLGTAAPGVAAAQAYRTQPHYRTRSQYIRHRRHMNTAKRVGVGAAGGAAVGALLGGGRGAGVGALAGAGAGYLYDRHKKHQGSY